MGDLALEVDHLSKRYLIGAASRDRLLHQSLVRALTNPFRRLTSLLLGESTYIDQDYLWALNDVSFRVDHGEIVGIVGRNGAGKSTLLKVLARITAPTSGQVRIYGSLGALLEVGAAFHIDLTARDNIYLHGSIYGRSRKQTDRIFRDIVEFAELERFVDTQIKKFSSGMYSRLAFSVAAHFDTEILIVDEVLATGDARFVNKCLKRMHEAALSGGTVLFVSHSLGAVASLCTRAIFMDQGRLIADGPARTIIEQYLSDAQDPARVEPQPEVTWTEAAAPAFADGTVRLRAVRSLDAGGSARREFDVTEPIDLEMEFEVLRGGHAVSAHFGVRDGTGRQVFVAMDNLDSPWGRVPVPPGAWRARCHLPANLLNEGTLAIESCLCTNPASANHITVAESLTLKIEDDRRPGGVRGDWDRDWPDAILRPRLHWEHTELAAGVAVGGGLREA